MALSEVKDLRPFQTHVTEKFRDLFQIFLEDAFVVLGQPPCAYDIRAIGSVGREEPCLYSVLEFFILIESEAHRHYFINLLHFLELQIMSLGETENQNIVFSCLNKKNAKGFYLDKGSSPLEISDLMGPPQEMAALQNRVLVTTNRDDKSDLTAVPSNQVLKSISLLKNHPIELFCEYQEAMVNILDRGERTLIRHTRALQLFETRSIDFDKTWGKKPDLSNPVNIKDRYVQFLNFFLSDLSLYFGVQATNTLDIIDALVENEVFTAKTGHLLQEAVSTIYRLRMRLHQLNQEHKEEGYLEGLSNCILIQSEKTELEKIYWLIIQPLFNSCLPQVLKDEVPVEKVFCNLDLFSVCLKDICASQGNPNFFLPFVRHCASYLVSIKEPFATHLNIFKKLSKRSDLEPLRKAYLDVLEKSDISKNELEQIMNVPNCVGIRFSFSKKEKELKNQIEAISSPDFHHDKTVSNVRLISSGKTRYLKPDVVRAILDESGDLKKDYLGSAHRVTSTHNLHFKQKPTHPLMEYAIHNLFFRISGELTPATELVRFEDGEKMYPVLISSTIPGKILKERIKDHFELENSQWARWTWMLLCSYFNSPGRWQNNKLCDGFPG